MDKFTHWLFNLSIFPRLIMLALIFGVLGGTLFFALRSPTPAPVNQVDLPSCDPKLSSLDPSSECSTAGTYHDFRYICGSGSEGYLGSEEPSCLTIDQATDKINQFCAVSCNSK